MKNMFLYINGSVEKGAMSEKPNYFRLNPKALAEHLEVKVLENVKISNLKSQKIAWHPMALVICRQLKIRGPLKNLRGPLNKGPLK